MESAGRRSKRHPSVAEDLDGRVDPLLGHRVFLKRTFQGLIMFRERTFSKARAEYRRDSVRFHDEGKFAGFSHGRCPSVGDITHPFFICRVPFQDRPCRIPRVSLQVHRGPVVDDPPVHRPAQVQSEKRPRPVGSSLPRRAIILKGLPSFMI